MDSPVFSLAKILASPRWIINASKIKDEASLLEPVFFSGSMATSNQKNVRSIILNLKSCVLGGVQTTMDQND